MITYLGMTAPIALAAAISWFRHPYKEGENEVKVAHVGAKKWAVLIIMWIMATIDDPSYLPMIVCFSGFFVNDCYGFINWRKIRQRQGEN